MTDVLPNLQGDNGTWREAKPVVIVGSPEAVSVVTDGDIKSLSVRDINIDDLLTRQDQIIANQTAIIALLTAGISVNVISEGGL